MFLWHTFVDSNAKECDGVVSFWILINLAKIFWSYFYSCSKVGVCEGYMMPVKLISRLKGGDTFPRGTVHPSTLPCGHTMTENCEFTVNRFYCTVLNKSTC